MAIWTDPNDINPDDDAATKKRKEGKPKLADSNNYSIFITGLSNGLSRSDPIRADEVPIIRRKTLQLSFTRLGDKYLMKSEAIRFQKFEWVYRASELKVKLPEKPKETPPG